MDLDAVSAAHPAIGRTINRAFLEDQAGILVATPGEFARAYGNRWTQTLEQVIPAVDWAAIRHRDAVPSASVPPVLAVDVAVDRSATAIVACWPDAEGVPVLEVIRHAPGVAWAVQLLQRIRTEQRAPLIVADSSGPVLTVVDELVQLKVPVTQTNGREYTTACAGLLDKITDHTVAHRGEPALDAAVAGAGRRTMGDGWGWGRRTSTADVSPLIAASLALWGHQHRPSAARPAVYAC
jgi:hypothetical protein